MNRFLSKAKILRLLHANLNCTIRVKYCVAVGSAVEISQLEKYLSKLGTRHQRLNVSHVFHSQFMESVEKPVKELLSNISLTAPVIPIVSNVPGTWLSAEDAVDSNYWYRHLRHRKQLQQLPQLTP